MPSILLVASCVVALIPILMSALFGGWLAKYTSPKFTFDDIPDLSGRVIIVTGANTGIGYVTVRELAKKGARVIATSRSNEKGKNALQKIRDELSNQDIKVEFLQLDLASLASIKTFAKSFKALHVRIDALILNAGVMMCPYSLTEDGFEMQIGTNHIGHFLLVKSLLPILTRKRKQGSGNTRIVHVSSAAHGMTHPGGLLFASFRNHSDYNPYLAYGQSKLANILFSNELSRRLNDSGITSNALHPGMIASELSRHFKSHPWISALDFFTRIFEYAAMMDVNTGALNQLYLATSPAVENVTGAYYIPIAVQASSSRYANNVTLQKQLWDYSERATKAFQ